MLLRTRSYKIMKRLLAAALALALGAYSVPASATLLSSSTMSLTIGAKTYASTRSLDGLNNGNPTQETATLNTAFGTSFIYLDKSDAASSPGIGGIQFTIGA